MKKSLLTFASVFALVVVCLSSAQAAVNQKVIKSFESVFTRAHDVKWSEYSDHFEAGFKQDDMILKVSYDKDGNMIGSMRYYTEQQLPVNVLCKIKKKYGESKINIVTEVSNEEKTAYFVQLEDKDGYTILKADEKGDIMVVDSFNKMPR
jgi:hypothetical protein